MKRIRTVLLIAPSLFLVTACATVNPPAEQAGHVSPGDAVQIEYTCRTPAGELAASTAPDVTLQGARSTLYKPRRGQELPVYTVSPTSGGVAVEEKMPMEEKIERYLVRQAAGKPVGEKVDLIVEGELFGGTGGDRFLPMRKNFPKLRRVTMSTSSFKQAFDVDPIVGLETETKLPGYSVKVESIQADKVGILYSIKPGTTMPSIFGEISITQTDDKFEMYTNAREGALVRSSDSLVGRISNVTDDTFVVDYGHSFGFVPLTCQAQFSAASQPPDSAPAQTAAAPTSR